MVVLSICHVKQRRQSPYVLTDSLDLHLLYLTYLSVPYALPNLLPPTCLLTLMVSHLFLLVTSCALKSLLFSH